MNSATTGAHIYTRTELNVLDKFRQGASLKQIADELHVSCSTVPRWLKSLGIYRQQYKHTKPRTRKAKCPRCGILLAEAPKGNETHCLWCLEEMGTRDKVEDNEWKQIH